jgi:rhodanese-related sulfurtransferase
MNNQQPADAQNDTNDDDALDTSEVSKSDPRSIELMREIDGWISHVWMVRTFLKHSDEAADDEELAEIHRGLYDFMLALGPSWDSGDAHRYLRIARKKIGKLKTTAANFRELQPEVSGHMNFCMAAKSLTLQNISPKDLNDIIRRGASIELIDVRTPVEFREVHLACAKNIPLDQLDPAQIRQSLSDPSKPVYVICRSGGRGKQGCEKLMAAGLSNVVNVEGGTLACDQAGLLVVRGKKAMSLERQVRIAAGSLTFVGAVLGYFSHPYWIGLSAFIGAGLVFAGVTDTCAMGMLIAKMPWNQVSSK